MTFGNGTMQCVIEKGKNISIIMMFKELIRKYILLELFSLHINQKWYFILEYGPITNISGEHGVIGFFEDGYIYLVNHDFIYERTFTITANQELARYENDEFISCGKKITITLSAGAGTLLKLQ